MHSHQDRSHRDTLPLKQLVAGSPRYYLLTQFLYYGPAVLNISSEGIEE